MAGKFDGEFGQGMMWIALLSRLGIILDRQGGRTVGRRCQGSARGPETPGGGYFGLLTRNKPPPDVLISIKTVGEAPMDATYLRALASRCHRSSRNCSDLFAKEEFRRLATELEATAQELEGPAKFDAAADTWRRSRPSRGYEGDH